MGAEALPIDRVTRRIGFRHHAARQFDDLAPRLRERLTAFAAGITAGASLGLPSRPHAFALLRDEPSPHSAIDVLAMLKLEAFLLANNWQDEIARLQVVLADGQDALTALDSDYAAHLPVTAPPAHGAGPAVAALAADLALLQEHAGLTPSSNNWALAGERTRSGKPLVANDPHLPPAIPSQWYLAHLVTPEWALAGAAFVGTPGIVSGHNGHGAWGVTAGLTDDSDLFLEEVGGDGASVRDGDGYVDCPVRREVIEVRDGDPVVEEVLETPRGPLIGPAIEDSPLGLSIRGVWLDGGPTEGFFDAATATDFDAFRSGFARWPGMTLNVVWGDAEGTIGWQLAGELPVRRSGYGTVPLAGWDPAVGWQEHRVAFEDMPHVVDPELGLVATANNKPRPDRPGEAFLGADYLDGYRAAAVIETLLERDDWDVGATFAAQLDVRSLPWLELRGALLGVEPTSGDARLARELLEDWDGQVAADSVGAAIYELTVASLCRRVVDAKAPRAGHRLLGSTPLPPALLGHTLTGLRRTAHLVDLLHERPADWVDSWDGLIVAALGDAVATLREHAGADPDGWAWGEVRPLRLRHPVARAQPGLAAVFERGPYPLGGDTHTVPQASVAPLEPLADPVAIASLRMAVDTGDWSASRWVLPGGQSENPLSPHFDDQLARWRDGRGVPIPWTEAEVDAATTEELRLYPTRPDGAPT